MQTSKTVRKLTAAALMTAVSLVLIYLAEVSPTLRLALVAMAGVTASFIVAESGPVYGILCYIATSVLALLIAPTTAWGYLLFFGWYPVVKCFIERIDRLLPEWILKVLVCNAVCAALWLLFPMVFTDFMPLFEQWLPQSMAAWIFFVVVILGANALFVFYDLGLSRVISYFIRIILPKIHKG